MKAQLPEVYFGPLITRNIKPSKSKAVAYLYQQAETQVMDIARSVLARNGIQPIACIHDAFIVRHKLSPNQRSEIILEIRDQTDNKHWTIKASRLEGFNFVSNQTGEKS
jgi:hypothetical protein